MNQTTKLFGITRDGLWLLPSGYFGNAAQAWTGTESHANALKDCLGLVGVDGGATVGRVPMAADLEDEHEALVHADGSECPDGCDAAGARAR